MVCSLSRISIYSCVADTAVAAIPKPKEADEQQQTEPNAEPQLPQTLVRIPIEQAEDAKKAMQESQAGG